MALTDNTYYINDISVAVGTYSDLSGYIEKFEKEVLIGLLGYTLYTEMMAAYAASIAETDPVTLPEKWDRLINGYTYQYNGVEIRWNGLINADKVSFIAYYVYCQYIKAKQSYAAGTGQVQSKNENSVVVDGIANYTAAWNLFVKLYQYSALPYLRAYPDEYDLAAGGGPCEYGFTNSFGI